MTYTLHNSDGQTLRANSAIPTDYDPEQVIILICGHHGRYTWQRLAEQFGESLYIDADAATMRALIDDLLAGPDSEHYWNASFQVEDECCIYLNNALYFLATLPDTQDIAAIPVGMRDGFNEAIETI